jgi:hypothetical protein
MGKKRINIDPVIVEGREDPRYIAYKDSLNLYNNSLNAALKIAEATALGYYNRDVKEGREYNVPLKQRYEDNRKFYKKTMYDPLIDFKNPEFGEVQDWKDEYWSYIEKDLSNYNKKLSDKDYSVGAMASSTEEGIKEAVNQSNIFLKNRSNKIQPSKVLFNAEMPVIPIYDKPVNPVYIREPSAIPSKEFPKLVSPPKELAGGKKFVPETVGKYWGRDWVSSSGVKAPEAEDPYIGGSTGGGYYYHVTNDKGKSIIMTPDEYSKGFMNIKMAKGSIIGKANIDVEAEGGELVLRNKKGDIAIIPKRNRTEAIYHIQNGNMDAINSLISSLPDASHYAQEGGKYIKKPK